MSTTEKYDVVVVGGGLAGLSLAIQLTHEGYKVVVYEKEKYPFHRVCGEYISFESWNFLEELGVPLSDWNLPLIKELLVSAPNGNCVEHSLPLGGFGISRYKLDSYLAQLANAAGVIILEETKVEDIVFDQDRFLVSAIPVRNQQSRIISEAKLVCGAFGKRSNIDVKWGRNFIRKKPNKLNNYIAVKYHVRTEQPANQIALHNFESGYCGISQIEDEKYCLCYLTTALNLRRCNNSIEEMEEKIIQRNPYLKRIFTESKFLYDSPVIIAQISFDKKLQVEDHVLMVGDAAGMITPLCGNGMSMALHASKIAFEKIKEFLKGNITRDLLELQYQDKWNELFEKRLHTGRLVQSLFGKRWLTNTFIQTLKPFPKLIDKLIRKTHGTPF
ncbi:MAG: pyridine nucleotide-disulfide oxidoreductase [Bacteroidetes bacterium]|nr:MAG: pyridine nucleotide-disulfide oxidoreductase [Bacteroidota bacterium]